MASLEFVSLEASAVQDDVTQPLVHIKVQTALLNDATELMSSVGFSCLKMIPQLLEKWQAVEGHDHLKLEKVTSSIPNEKQEQISAKLPHYWVNWSLLWQGLMEVACLYTCTCLHSKNHGTDGRNPQIMLSSPLPTAGNSSRSSPAVAWWTPAWRFPLRENPLLLSFFLLSGQRGRYGQEEKCWARSLECGRIGR